MSRRTLVAALGVAAVAVGGALGGVLAVHGTSKISLSASSEHDHHGQSYQSYLNFQNFRMNHPTFSTLNDQNDPTFNQLLGINNRNQIAGYFGSGAAGHPNKGYVLNLSRNFSFFQNENHPFGLQTQVIGINDIGTTVGFWSNQNNANVMTNDNFGFYTWQGHFHTVNFPARHNANPPVNQLLGVNDSNIAVGFYTDANGNNHGYAFSIPGHWFARVNVPGAKSVSASGINNRGDIAGFFTGQGGVTRGFVRWRNGQFKNLTFPGATSTMAFGINDSREVVGTYMIGTGNAAKTFGFTWSTWAGWRTINDPKGPGATTLNGINDAGDLVGFYVDSAGHTDGLLLSARHFRAPFAAPLTTATPTMTPAATPTATPTGSTPATPAPVPSATGPTHF
jgi:hypothetical protein